MNDLATSFTPVSAALGGIIIGLSAVLLLAANGRLAGISSIIAALTTLRPGGPRVERGAFALGLILGPFLVAAIRGWPEQTLVAGAPMLVVAGLLVGAGTIVGGGCTSGHGVCGIARLSPRSIVATVTFVVVAALTVFVLRHVVGG